MKLYLAKPDLTYYGQYNEMMIEWNASKTRVAPWFLDEPFANIEEFAQFIRMLDDCEHGIVDKKFASTTSYFVIDEKGKLIGATSLRHYLTVEGYQTWGHIGYGVRPMLEQAKEKKIRKVLIGVYEGNVGAWRTVEKCGGVLENTVHVENADEPIRRYWIDIL